MSENVIVTSSRLQPIHEDHLAFWEHLEEKFDDHLVICVLREVPPEASAEVKEDAETYEEYSGWTRRDKQNPLSEWERLRLAEIAVSNSKVLSNSASVIFRERPDISWGDSLSTLPDSRRWAFNVTKSAFDSTKPQHYESRGEDVVRVEFGKPSNHEGSKIREALRTGSDDLSFLPSGCHNYFRDHCLSQFRARNHDH